jgi:hypothetical protein
MERQLRLAPFVFILLSAARAEAQTLPYHVEYVAETGCSSQEAFVHELLQFTDRAREAAYGEEAGTFTVKLAPSNKRIGGQLILKELDGDETRRGTSGDDCDQVVKDLAHIAASLIDPNVLSGAPPPDPERTVAPEEKREKRTGFRFGGALGASLHGGVSPNVAYGGFAEFSMEYERLFTRAFSFGAAFHQTFSKEFSEGTGSADFTWTAGRLWFCPVSLPHTGVFAFAPCATVEMGGVYTDRSGSFVRTDSPPFWLATGPMIRLEVRPIRYLSIFADGLALIAPLEPYEYRVDPAVIAFETPLFSWAAQAGVRFLVP